MLRDSVAARLRGSVAGRVMLRFREVVSSFREFSEDCLPYIRDSTPPDRLRRRLVDPVHLECVLTKDYHRVEKGMSLRAPKRPFGVAVSQRMIRNLKEFEVQGHSHLPFVGYSREALVALDAWNASETRDSLLAPPVEEYIPNTKLFEKFFSSRSSVRSFDCGKPVDTGVLKEAVRLAGFSPSVCNRQAWRVHFYTESVMVDRVLRLQNGNSSFRTEVPCVAVVTVDRRLFSGIEERNQRWVDGGIFAMSLVWSIHSLGLSSCMLNWSVKNKTSRDLRQQADIRDFEDIIVLIAIGHADPNAKRARSPRRDVTEVARFHAGGSEMSSDEGPRS